MKSKFYIFASILVVLCMICSCGGSGGSAESEAQQVVALSMDVNTDNSTRAISVTNPTLDGFTYQYSAKALFDSEFGTPKGNTVTGSGTTVNLGWTDFADTTTGLVGDFAQGYWEFQVRVIKKAASGYSVDDPTTYTLAYQTDAAEKIYLNAKTTAAPIVINVVKQTDNANGAKGTLSIASITAATADPEYDKLVVSWGKIGAAQEDTTDIAATSRTTSNPYRTTFTNTISMDPGQYWVTFAYSDGTNIVGASTKFVEIIKNVITTVSGALDANKWVATSFTIKGIKTITCENTATSSEYAKASVDYIDFSFKGWLTENTTKLTDDVKYYFSDGVNPPVLIGTYEGSDSTARSYRWYINDNAETTNVTENVAKGYYYITIIASDSTGTLATENATPIKITIK